MRRSRFRPDSFITGGLARGVQHRLIVLYLIVGAAFALAVPEARAQAGEGDAVSSSECCAAMLFPIGARTVALGQALTASGGLESMFMNPAGLTDVTKDEFVAHRATLADNKVTTFTVLLVSKGIGVFGLTYRLIDFGTQDETDINGNPIGSISVIDQQLIASFATHMSVGLSAGIAYDVGRLLRRDTTTAAWVHVDLVGRARELSTPAVNIGLEVILDNTIFLRVGHASAGDGITSGGTGIGVGLKFQRFDVGVAKTVTTSPVFENAGEPFHVSFAVSF